MGSDTTVAAPDGGTALGLSPARLTLTFGFGPGLFLRDGQDRFGLAARRPAALMELPRFNGDQMDPARCGGDLSVQACADDPQVAFHAVRELVRLAYGRARPRWAQTGFLPDTPAGQTPRNLMGFKDGTNNPHIGNAASPPDLPRGFDDVVWVGDEGPAWMRGGTYVVSRRIRISLEHWDRTEVDFQEQVIGRRKYSGAPIGKTAEFDELGLDRVDQDGNPVIADNAHVRLGAAAANGGAQILRRAYSYNDGLSFTAERWPPWRQGMMYDAGLHFLAYQRDPRAGFIRIYENMSKLDALNQFTTHTASAVFACPPGVAPGEFVGQRLFAA
jgi:deferrochelatase/peroxidase EfeB